MAEGEYGDSCLILGGPGSGNAPLVSDPYLRIDLARLPVNKPQFEELQADWAR